MNIKTITAGHSRKEGRPNYGSEDYHFSLTIEVEPGEDLTELANGMFETCRAKVNEQFAAGKESVIAQGTEGVKPGGAMPYDWKNTPGGERWLQNKAEIDQNFGEENGERGSNFGEEDMASTSGQQ